MLDDRDRRMLRAKIRSTMKEMATTCQNVMGMSPEEALAYVVSEAQWVEAFYLQQQAISKEAGSDA